MKATLAIIFLISTSLACFPGPEPVMLRNPEPVRVQKIINRCEPIRMELGPNAVMLIDCDSEELEGGREVWKFWMRTLKADSALPFTAEKLASAINGLGKLDLTQQAAEELVPLLNQPQGMAGFKILAEKTQGVSKVLRSNIDQLRFYVELVEGITGTISFLRNEANDQNIWDVRGDSWDKATSAQAMEVAAKIVREKIAQEFSDQQAEELATLLQGRVIARLHLEKKRDDAGLSADDWKVIKVELSPTDPTYEKNKESQKLIRI